VRKALIEKNAMREHEDEPQDLAQGRHAVLDLVARGRVAGRGDPRQCSTDFDNGQAHGIYMGNNEARGGNKDMFFKNILIENNEFTTGQSHGITVEHGIDVTVRQNTVLKHKDAGNMNVHIPLITVSVASEDVKILNNVVASVQNTQKSGWTISGNDTTHTNLLHWGGSYQRQRAPGSRATRTRPPSKNAGRRRLVVLLFLHLDLDPGEDRAAPGPRAGEGRGRRSPRPKTQHQHEQRPRPRARQDRGQRPRRQGHRDAGGRHPSAPTTA
jgi:hypothetical protein